MKKDIIGKPATSEWRPIEVIRPKNGQQVLMFVKSSSEKFGHYNGIDFVIGYRWNNDWYNDYDDSKPIERERIVAWAEIYMGE